MLWLWQQLIEYKFCSLKENALIDAFELADEYGINLNHLSSIRDNSGQELFHGSVSHLLADTTGDFSQLQPFNECIPSYERLLSCVLDLGLQIDLPNRQRLSAIDIAKTQKKQYVERSSAFNNFIKKYDLNRKLNESLKTKTAFTRRPGF